MGIYNIKKLCSQLNSRQIVVIIEMQKSVRIPQFSIVGRTPFNNAIAVGQSEDGYKWVFGSLRSSLAAGKVSITQRGDLKRAGGQLDEISIYSGEVQYSAPGTRVGECSSLLHTFVRPRTGPCGTTCSSSEK